MTSPRVCLFSEPCQATLPARSQAPPGRVRQQATASRSRGVPTRWLGQPGSGRELHMFPRIPNSRVSWQGDPNPSWIPGGWCILGSSGKAGLNYRKQSKIEVCVPGMGESRYL